MIRQRFVDLSNSRTIKGALPAACNRPFVHQVTPIRVTLTRHAHRQVWVQLQPGGYKPNSAHCNLRAAPANTINQKVLTRHAHRQVWVQLQPRGDALKAPHRPQRRQRVGGGLHDRADADVWRRVAHAQLRTLACVLRV